MKKNVKGKNKDKQRENAAKNAPKFIKGLETKVKSNGETKA